MVTYSRLLPVAVFCCLVGIALTAASQVQEVTAWMQNHAIPILSAEPSDDFSDLEPLRALIGDARVVGLGEQTHGTHEFVTLKHRLIRFLVEEMGFTAVALEGTWGGGLLADRYVVDGSGTLDRTVQALDGWIYSCSEFMDIISWMRNYNREAENPVHLVGIDNKFANSALTWFRKLLPYSGAPYDASFIRDIESRLPMKAVNLSSENATIREETFAFLQSIVERLFVMLPEIEDDLTALEWSIIQHIPRAIEQVREYADIWEANQYELGWQVHEVFNYRDACMAENALWWLDQLGEDAKIIVYAHNGHVARDWPNVPSVPLGKSLSDALGDAYVAVGFSTSEGTCIAGDPETLAFLTLELPLPTPGSYESALGHVAIESFALDLRALRADTPEAEWMNTRRDFKMVGSLPNVVEGVITSAYEIEVVLPSMFDVLIHIQSTTPMDLGID